METNSETGFSVDRENRKITVRKKINAPISKVWPAWTKREILDKWWAPKPWKSETKTMDFKNGGSWLYAMVGPKGEKHWGKADFDAIIPQKSFSAHDAFTDENGTINPELPRALWKYNFAEEGESTVISIEIEYESDKDLEETLKMGFKEGFQMGLHNLDELLKS